MKKNILWLLLDLIFLIVFNTIFFLAGGTHHNASVWLSYGFIHFSYIMLLITPMLTKKSKSSAVFGFALGSVAISYFYIEFIIGIIFIFIAPENWKIAFIVQFIVASVFAISLISNMIANENTAENEIKSQLELNYMKMAAKELLSITESIKNHEIQKRIERIYDDVASSQVKSHPSVAALESGIMVGINGLKNAVKDDNHAEINYQLDNLQQLLAQRNSQLRLSN